MTTRRRFNARERIALFMASSGKCSICGASLGRGWHADHVVPFSAGGPTDIANGQALCAACNLEKGAIMDNRDRFKPRGHQARLAQAVEEKMATGEMVHTANVFPGSGKTSAYLNALNLLYRNDEIDTGIILTPRINLAVQAELDWRSMVDRGDFAIPYMGTILHRDNRPPLIGERGQFGYATTYASLTSAIDFHLNQLRGRRVAVVCDEAQQLGMSDDGVDDALGTKSAHAVMRLAEISRKVFIMTGTPYRADGKPLVLAKYTEPNDEGKRYLVEDVKATYREGVDKGYLRPFDFTVVDAEGTFEYLTGETERMVLSEMETRIGHILRRGDVWKPMVDMTVERVRHVQGVDRRYAGLIAAVDQRHADEILRHLRDRHPSIRALVATSDKSDAQDNLRQFKMGGYDILITVAMAHVGYDHQPITVVCMLSTYREWGWVLQLLARGLRVMTEQKWPGAPSVETQVLHAIIPGDKKAVDIAEWLRTESEIGVQERAAREAGDRSPADPLQQQIGTMQYAEITGKTVIAYDPDGDIASDDYAAVESIVKRHPSLGAVARGELKKVFDELGVLMPAPESHRIERVDSPQMTQKEKENARRMQINKVMRRFDAQLKAAGVPADYGYTATVMKSVFGVGMTDRRMSEAELDAREEWLKGEWAENVKQLIASRHSYVNH